MQRILEIWLATEQRTFGFDRFFDEVNQRKSLEKGKGRQSNNIPFKYISISPIQSCSCDSHMTEQFLVIKVLKLYELGNNAIPAQCKFKLTACE